MLQWGESSISGHAERHYNGLMDARKILGIQAGAGREEIRQAYREKVKKHHPDRGGDNWAFQQVNQAYEFLMAELDGGKGAKQSTSSKPNSSSQARAPRQAHTSPRQTFNSTGQFSQKDKGKPRSQTESDHFRSTQSTSATRRSARLPWGKVLTSELPLQNETSLFILINVLDIFMTYIVLRLGGQEANSIARYFFDNWNIKGMVIFKLAMVTLVCLISQFVAYYQPRTAKLLLNFGSAIVGLVVLYSVWLLANRIL